MSVVPRGIKCHALPLTCIVISGITVSVSDDTLRPMNQFPITLTCYGGCTELRIISVIVISIIIIMIGTSTIKSTADIYVIGGMAGCDISIDV